MTKQTSLINEHKKLGAIIADFAGWEMPIRYNSIKDEVTAVRNTAGMFDVSHMGEFFLTGPDATALIDYIMTNDYQNSPVSKAVYSPLCNSEGCIIDDAIAYKISEDLSLLCVNASNINKDKEWILKVISEKNFDCKFQDASDEYSLIAIQGPESEAKLQLATGDKLTELQYYSVFRNEKFIYARTGYTGEDGFEVFGSHEDIQNLWGQLSELNVTPCGLAARDVLRLEVAFPLYGQDLNDTLTPLDCGLKWTVKMQKESFSGKKSLEKYSPKFQLVKFQLENGIPRMDQVIFQGEEAIGKVTSGTMSTTLNKGICLALVDFQKFHKEALHFLEIRGKKYPAQFTNKPFVRGGHK